MQAKQNIRKGSIVVCWDQVLGNVLAKVLEVQKDGYKVQSGKLTLEYRAWSVRKYTKEDKKNTFK